jgi:hypothetical protein
VKIQGHVINASMGLVFEAGCALMVEEWGD